MILWSSMVITVLVGIFNCKKTRFRVAWFLLYLECICIYDIMVKKEMFSYTYLLSKSDFS